MQIAIGETHGSLSVIPEDLYVQIAIGETHGSLSVIPEDLYVQIAIGENPWVSLYLLYLKICMCK